MVGRSIRSTSSHRDQEDRDDAPDLFDAPRAPLDRLARDLGSRAAAAAPSRQPTQQQLALAHAHFTSAEAAGLAAVSSGFRLALERRSSAMAARAGAAPRPLGSRSRYFW
jgi:hypothetical protein